ncbi:hypothetical protein SAMN05421504_1021030 [Amycolatopsis xylanica]|uniref:Uncharacterized protein n=1 Tax=Amycolatopsis xylanica TaxID=589385 RepID=A0A1H3ARN6_9PSEU|nr:hypothetical protein [Amycolatopsis xylanica]SDX32265.1 hypothetical protein SAMN05421504_1021030 [Amycolatopsis xylanica]
MTDEIRGLGGAVGPPWSVDVLADLHAGVLDERQAAELWPLVNADPEARAIIEALESTQADLAGLAVEAVPMPAEYAARLDAALAEEVQAAFPRQRQAESAPVAPVVSLDAARQRRRKKQMGWGAGILTAAAAAAVAVAVIVPSTSSKDSSTPGVAAPVPSGPSVASDGAGSEALVGKGIGLMDYGPLQSKQKLDACLDAAGIDSGIQPAGVQPVNVNGKAGTMAILTTGKFAQYRLVAFDTSCAKLFDKTIGEK